MVCTSVVIDFILLIMSPCSRSGKYNLINGCECDGLLESCYSVISSAAGTFNNSYLPLIQIIVGMSNGISS